MNVGPWTSHGHPVPGVTVAGDRPPAIPVARCGGPAICSKCATEAAAMQAAAGVSEYAGKHRREDGESG